eukprot:g34479.t1
MIDDGKLVDVVSMNFSKVFDKVLHGRLVQKVKSHGVRGGLARWIQNWLSHRRQRVAVDGCCSEWRVVTIGPLLFLISINDLEENVADLISKFADDTKIDGIADSEENYQRTLQDADQLEAWAEKWQMEFNPDKCE